MQFVRQLTVPASSEHVFAYLSDFTTTNEWDPATVRTERVSGTGGVGTRYRNVSRFMGREAEVMYVVTQLEPDRRFTLRGENGSLVAEDDMRVQGRWVADHGHLLGVLRSSRASARSQPWCSRRP